MIMSRSEPLGKRNQGGRDPLPSLPSSRRASKNAKMRVAALREPYASSQHGDNTLDAHSRRVNGGHPGLDGACRDTNVAGNQRLRRQSTSIGECQDRMSQARSSDRIKSACRGAPAGDLQRCD